jgi:hypothetical protein
MSPAHRRRKTLLAKPEGKVDASVAPTAPAKPQRLQRTRLRR